MKSKKGWIFVYVSFIHFAAHIKLTTLLNNYKPMRFSWKKKIVVKEK